MSATILPDWDQPKDKKSGRGRKPQAQPPSSPPRGPSPKPAKPPRTERAIQLPPVWAVAVCLLVAALILRQLDIDPLLKGLLLLGTLLLLLGTALRSFLVLRSTPVEGRPAAPRPETLRPIVMPKPPPMKILVIATSCAYCSRPLTDPLSMRMGAGPTCRSRYGNAQRFTINPAYVQWGLKLQRLRVAQEAARGPVEARNLAAMAAHRQRLLAWEEYRKREEVVAKVALRRKAVQGLSAGLLCAAFVSQGGFSFARPAAVVVASSTQPIAEPTTEPLPSDTPTQSPEIVADAGTASTDITPGSAEELATSAPSPATDPYAYAPASEAPSVAPKLQPFPGTLSDRDTLRADPDCVGGVCSLIKRLDVLQRDPSTGTATRIIVALVHFPDDPDLGNAYGFIAVDAATRQKIGDAGLEHAVDPPTGSLRKDVSDTIWFAMNGKAGEFNSGPHVELIGVSPTGLSDDGILASSSSSDTTNMRYVTLDRSGHHVWKTDEPRDGSVVTTTWGWDGNSYGAVSCTRARNGEAVTYKPESYSC